MDRAFLPEDSRRNLGIVKSLEIKEAPGTVCEALCKCKSYCLFFFFFLDTSGCPKQESMLDIVLPIISKK